MSFDVISRAAQQLGRVPELADGLVTAGTQQPPDFPGCVAVVNCEALHSGIVAASADAVTSTPVQWRNIAESTERVRGEDELSHIRISLLKNAAAADRIAGWWPGWVAFARFSGE